MEKDELAETISFKANFGSDSLIPCITVDANSGQVLMFAYMNKLALTRTLASGEAHYWSRSRSCLWRKGETSGNTQRLIEMRIDCDQDCLLMLVEVGGNGVACHTGQESCFYRRIVVSRDGLSLKGVTTL